MIKLAPSSRCWGFAVALIALAASYSTAAFTSKTRIEFSAGTTLTPGGSPSGGALALAIPNLLPVQAFFGKNVEIPIQIQGAPAVLAQYLAQGPASGINVQMQYQQLSQSGVAVGGQSTVPISFHVVPNDSSRLLGVATIPVQTLLSIRQGGLLAYQFLLQNGPTQTIYQNGGAPFQVQFIESLTQPVSNTGSVVIAPDTALLDGKTAFSFAPGVLSNGGNITIRQVDPFRVPAGPGGLSPIVVYDFELQGTSLLGAPQVTLSYPSNPDGSIIGSNGNPANLSLYGLQGSNWFALGPRQWNSSLHTYAASGAGFTTYALFLAAGTSAADLRPRQRVITPNRDGRNESISFTGIGTNEVKIFSLQGRRVKTLTGPTLDWDGTDEENRIVESGMYIYQYSAQGELVSGVILIAK